MTVHVLRESRWILIDSARLVPGDIIRLQREETCAQFPCDALLLDGECIMDENMLTGETIPVTKRPSDIIDDETMATVLSPEFLANNDKSTNVIYAGTRLVKLTPSSTMRDACLAMVLRTGFHSKRGQLIRAIMYPKPSYFKFYEDAIKFVMVLAALALFAFGVSAYQLFKLGVRVHSVCVVEMLTLLIFRIHGARLSRDPWI